jgi:hypothetical protein
VDEKSQIQALDRTQPGLPLKKGRCGTMTHDYKRNGTTTLFAALEVAEGKVVGQCFARHRNREFLKFLRRLDQDFPGDLPLHLVMDNYGTHKHPNIQAWLKKHPRFIPHFVPTSSSWLNLVERWFSELAASAHGVEHFAMCLNSSGLLKSLWTPGIGIQNRLSGQPPWIRSLRNCNGAGKPSKTSSRNAPCRVHEKGEKK